MELPNINTYKYKDFLEKFGYKPIFIIRTTISDEQLFILDIKFPIRIDIDDRLFNLNDTEDEIVDDNFNSAISKTYSFLLSKINLELEKIEKISFLKRQFLDSIQFKYIEDINKLNNLLIKIDINTEEGIESFSKRFIDHNYYCHNMDLNKEIKVLEKFKKEDKLYLVKACFISDLYEPVHEITIEDIECSYYTDTQKLQSPYYTYSYSYNNELKKDGFSIDNNGKIINKSSSYLIFESKKEALDYKENILKKIYLECQKLVNF